MRAARHHDWAIQAVTVCERAGRRERKVEPCHRYQPNVVVITMHLLRALTWNDSTGSQLPRRGSPHRKDRQCNACNR